MYVDDSKARKRTKGPMAYRDTTVKQATGMQRVFLFPATFNVCGGGGAMKLAAASSGLLAREASSN